MAQRRTSKASTLKQQAEEIMEMAESSGLQENYFFKTTFERYLTQLDILSKLKITIDSSEALVEKEYVKGRACVGTRVCLCHPRVHFPSPAKVL